MFAPEKIVKQHVHSDGTTTYLIVSSQMSYFSPSGKARLAVRVRYHVYANMVEGEITNGERSKHGFTSKAAATKYFKGVVS